MKFWEAMKEMEKGKKVRNKDWTDEQYIYLTADNEIFDEHNNECYLNFIGTKDSEWEIYDDRKPSPTILKTLANDLSCNSSDICMRLSFDEQVELVAVLARLNMEYKIY